MINYNELIKNKIIQREDVLNFKKSLRIKNLVFTNGCFDILHFGHLDYLSRARTLGDFLWIGLNSDFSVKKLKGSNRPINSEYDRAFMLASLIFVDAVTIFAEDTPIKLISDIQPNIHVKGGDYTPEKMPEYSTVKEYGGKIEILPFVEGRSTTNIINKINNSPYGKET